MRGWSFEFDYFGSFGVCYFKEKNIYFPFLYSYKIIIIFF